ncbi:DUF2846 domain-containing protein [Microbulbifer sp. SSSA008]|uniref:DUF2846 domain-containing protein n=1 Tax=Microbulbifer sp. SSSA008 TaxID=3243380 RepID=UPI00403A29A3
MYKSLLISVFLSVTLSGCSASGPMYTEYKRLNSDTGVLYLYRESSLVNMAVGPKVYIDGGGGQILKNGGYLAYELSPGKHTIIVGDDSFGFDNKVMEVDLKQGENLYIKWKVGSLTTMEIMVVGDAAAGYGERDYHLIAMPGSVAAKEISALKLSK